MTERHKMAHALACAIALALAACGSSHSVDGPDAATVDGGPQDATVSDAGPRDATLLDAVFLDAVVGDATTLDAATLDAATLDAATLDAGPSPCDGLGAAACFRDLRCSPVFDDVCCSTCTPGPCADCTDYTYIACRPFDGCREYCGTSPSWACYPTAPDCTGARPIDADSCSLTGCVPATAPIGGTPLVDLCVPITGDSCTVLCRRLPPDCPAGTAAEGDGSCYTDRCIPAFVCD